MISKNELTALRLGLDAIILKLDEAKGQANTIAKQIDKILANGDTLANPTPKLKRPNGRLTDEGVKIMHMMFDAGKSDADIARHFGITASGVLNRRENYAIRKHYIAESQKAEKKHLARARAD